MQVGKPAFIIYRRLLVWSHWAKHQIDHRQSYFYQRLTKCEEMTFKILKCYFIPNIFFCKDSRQPFPRLKLCEMAIYLFLTKFWLRSNFADSELQSLNWISKIFCNFCRFRSHCKLITATLQIIVIKILWFADSKQIWTQTLMFCMKNGYISNRYLVLSWTKISRNFE